VCNLDVSLPSSKAGRAAAFESRHAAAMIAVLRSINSKTRALDGANAVGTTTGPRMRTPI
jgi:hypothetical protein